MTSETLQIKNENEDELLKLAGVIGVGLIGNGRILVYVPEITSQIKATIPQTVNGIPIQLIRTGGKFVPLGFTVPPAAAIYAERTARIRPAPGGVSVGHPQVTAGTLSCRARDKQTGQILGLSNNHVIALNWGDEHTGVKGDPILQPGPYDGGKIPDDIIGTLNRWIPVEYEDTLVDAAAFLSTNLSEQIDEVGKPDTLLEPYAGLKVLKSGRTSAVTFGDIIDVNATITVSGWGDCTFKDQITMTKMLDPGDSGSWVGAQDTFQTVGIGHAGSPDISVACKGRHVEEMLSLEIISPIGTLPWYTVMGIWGTAFSIGQALISAWKPTRTGMVM